VGRRRDVAALLVASRVPPDRGRAVSDDEITDIRAHSTQPPAPHDDRRMSRPGLHASTPQEAAFYDSVVVPRYSALFSRPLLDAIPQGTRGQVLDLGCGTGHPAIDVLRRMTDHGRVIAVDRDSGLIDLARRRALEAHGKRIFFKVEPATELSFGDEVFDIVVGNLVLGAVDSELSWSGTGAPPGERAVMGEIRRVLTPGGRALLSRPLAGTFEEVVDMLREVALRRDLAGAQKRVELLSARYPTREAWADQLSSAGFAPVDVQAHEHKLAFKTARDLFADPLVRAVAVSEWRWVAGLEAGSETVLEDCERALETYFAGGPISLTVIAGAAQAGRPS
jgi:ubiquinone/menaquinone biosynthesis C-methylase UbiE